MTGNERAEVVMGVLQTEAQRSYSARKRNDKKKAKKASAKLLRTESPTRCRRIRMRMRISSQR